MSGISLSNRRDTLTAAAAAAIVALFALIFAAAIANQPLLALLVPLLLVTAVACARWPAAAVTVVLFITGTFGAVQAFTGTGPLVGVDLLLAGLWLSVLLTHAVSRRERAWWVSPGLAITLLFLLISFFETFTAISVGLGLLSFKDTGWAMLTVALLAFAAWSRETYVRILKAYVTVALLVSGYAVLRLFTGPTQSEEDLAFAAATTFNTIDGELSLIGPFTTRHELAFWTACAIPVCLAVALTANRPRWRLAGGVAVALCFAASFGTDVRAAIPAVVSGSALVIVLNMIASRGRGTALAQALTGLVLAITIGAGLFVVVVGDKTDRYGALFSPSGDLAYEGRMTKWKAALEDIDQHPFGLGLATAGKLAERGGIPFVTTGSSNVDSSYLKIALEQGFPVLAIFVIGMLALLVGLARRAVKVRDGPIRALAIAGSGTLAAGLTMFVTGEYIESPVVIVMWVVVGAAIGAISTEEEAETGEPETDSEGAPEREKPGGEPALSAPPEPRLR